MWLGSKLRKMINSNRDHIENTAKTLELIQMSLGRIELRQLENSTTSNPTDWEFKVSSQWGEDGLIQYLLKHVIIDRKIFVEFGVEDYKESNTRFLLKLENWSGLVFDGSASNIQTLKNDEIFWRYNLKAECTFITKDNISGLIRNQGISGDIGLLSVDIDGNDYWVWDAITGINPRIVIAEYNGAFGAKRAVTIPYEESFHRTKASSSNIYFGASLKALEILGKKKGYELIACNKAGNNAFFVRKDLVGTLKPQNAESAYVPSQFREARDADGKFLFATAFEALNMIADLPLVDVETSQLIRVADLNK